MKLLGKLEKFLHAGTRLAPIKRLSATALVIVVFVLSVLAWLKPGYNPDLVLYVAAASGESNPKQVFDVTYSDLKASVPPATYAALTQWDGAHNPALFVQYIPFDSVKRLYVAAIRVIHWLGFSFTNSAVALSILSFWGVAAVLWIWVREWAALLVVCPPLLHLLRLQTPDCFALVIVLGGLCLILRRHEQVGGLLLVISVLARPDALIVAGVVLFGFALIRRITIPWFLALSLFAVAEYFFANRGGLSWGVLFNSFFTEPMKGPAEVSATVTPHMYLVQVAREMLNFESPSGGLFLLLLLVGVMAWVLNRQRDYRALILCSAAASILHFLSYPNLETRYFAPMLLIPMIALINAVRTTQGANVVDGVGD